MGLLRKLSVVVATIGTLSIWAPAPAGAFSTDGCPKTYKVVRNDSWSRIADKAKVSMNDLLAVNKATTRSMLLIGDRICLPKTAKVGQATGGLKLSPPAKRWTAKEAAEIIREVWPDRIEDRAVDVARRESKLNAASYSSCCVGLFQLNWEAHRSWMVRMGIGSAQELLDARTNAEAALELYRRNSGFGPWE